MFTVIPASHSRYRVAFSGARHNKSFDSWLSNPMDYGQAVVLRLRLIRATKRASARRLAQQAHEAGWTGLRVDALGVVWGYEPGQTEDLLSNVGMCR